MFVMKRNDAAPALERWTIENSTEFRRGLLQLPSEDYLNPSAIDMIRVVRDKPDRSTGEVLTKVHIECKGSWFSTIFDEVDEARGFARTVCNFRDEYHR
ncbi:hypothetical protein HOU00_gp081 [Caulobacter phage CcrPW]|uniref:Uncharacterized protein n=1 Tax=Caulobacter phage CcrPW TaxID=2283271 RepID=A0A385EAA8_9CAUD|nr:hypothetical protein HOU00_gp081 [Caulobacter phage CcrPW]AXQ68620.1 hypothetical protein CcrPW_gp081 [Caulobacter phage CcrPW]